jgi:hypothetical protein
MTITRGAGEEKSPAVRVKRKVAGAIKEGPEHRVLPLHDGLRPGPVDDPRIASLDKRLIREPLDVSAGLLSKRASTRRLKKSTTT